MSSEGRRRSWRRKSWISTSSTTHHLHAGNVTIMFLCFCDLSPKERCHHHCRQKNWITLKMKKLMKTRSRDQQHGPSSAPPLRSESCEGLDNSGCRDNGSFTGSQGSEESASNSLNGDGPSPRKSSSEYDFSYLKRSSSNQERPEKIPPISSKHFVPTPASSGQANSCVNVFSSPVLFRKIFNSPKTRKVQLQEKPNKSE